MLSRSALKKTIEPCLTKNSFHFSHDKNDTFVYQHYANHKLKILFTFRHIDKSVGCHLQRGNINDLFTNYPLAMFLEAISPAKVIKHEGFWFYRSDEELLEVLEEQAELLMRYGFNWLFDCLELSIEES